MTKLTTFDVLVVYSQNIARSASAISSPTPFAPGSRNESYNTVYGYFLHTCQRAGLSVAFTTSADIIGPGFCRSFWTFNDGVWQKNTHTCYSRLIFDKFSPTSPGMLHRRQLLFSDKSIQPFNHPELYNLFFDKQKTYDALSGHSIPTLSIDNTSPSSVESKCAQMVLLMSSHSGNQDFTTDLIMKDRFGAGGRNVYKIDLADQDKINRIALRHPKINFIIQPFAKFDQGYSYQDLPSSTDIRLIFLKGKIIQSYLRVAKTGDFRCNEHQGGSLVYVNIDQIPSAVVTKAIKISQILQKSCSLYALDFIITNSGNIYLLEGNTGPGLDWNMNLSKNEIEAKKLIQLVVSELSLRASIN
jgi:hypothetical protein